MKITEVKIISVNFDAPEIKSSGIKPGTELMFNDKDMEKLFNGISEIVFIAAPKGWEKDSREKNKYEKILRDTRVKYNILRER